MPPRQPNLVPPSRPVPALRQARWAVTLIFITNGALLTNIVPRYPEITASLGLSYLDFGLAAAAFPIGAIVFGLFAGAVLRRLGSARVAVIGTLLVSLGMLAAGLAPAWVFLASALFFTGAMDAITDVAQNAQGLRLQRLSGKSILNSFHAAWSVGAVTGGAMGAAAAALEVPLALHLAGSGILFSALSLGAYRFLVRGPEPTVSPPITSLANSDSPPRGRRLPASAGPLAVLALLAIGGTLIEDSGITWSTFYLTDTLRAAASTVGLGLIAFLSAQFVGRITGDAAVNRFGQRVVTRVGAGLIVLGMGFALAFPSTVGSIAGFAAAGLGVATLVPATMHAANELPGLAAGSGLTIVTWLMRLGFLLSPLIVGGIADVAGLRVGLLIVPVVGVVILVLASVFAGVARPEHPALADAGAP